VGETGLDFLSKQPVPDELLSAKLARGPLSTEETLRYAIEIGSALHKIHSRGLVHGALSPFCIVLAAGGARILEGTSSAEDHAAYRAPEQLRGEEPDVRSDVFAYGALVYELASREACVSRSERGIGTENFDATACAAIDRFSHFGRFGSGDCGLHRERSGAPPAACAERGDRIETGGGAQAPRGRRA
jgi:hypothetical protein